jgi:predicted dehydrogenase
MRIETTADAAPLTPGDASARLPRLGFLGLGWIGRSRMEALAATGRAEIAALADPSPDMLAAALALAPGAAPADGLEGLLSADLDGIVVATPSAQHAAQSIAALQRGLAVFCQKPLGRDAAEVEAVLAAARRADRLVGVDFSYRHTAALQRLRAIVAGGEFGEVFAVELAFHNAYGPDKPWFYDARQSGGGCLMDLGVHLVDTALWILDFPAARVSGASLFHHGQRLHARADTVEDYATARLSLAGGADVSLACSWNLHAGRDAIIEATFHGTQGGARFHNLDGSFYDFALDLHRGTSRERLVEPPDAWGGRALVAWSEALAASNRYDPAAEEVVKVASVIDGIYGAAARTD